jgi:hypothetical protein
MWFFPRRGKTKDNSELSHDTSVGQPEPFLEPNLTRENERGEIEEGEIRQRRLDLQSYLGSCVLRPRNSPFPAFGIINKGAIGQPR